MSDDYSGRQWNLVTLSIKRAAEEFAGFLLFELGATGIITLEEGADDVTLGAYFDERDELREIQNEIERGFDRAGLREQLMALSVASVPDQDWMQKWKEGFEPIEVGDRLLIAPSWKLPSCSGGRIVVEIDPGMAFGTGTHETTRLCLELIERHWRGGLLLDVGTGTGILAIAAALLQPGARAVAIDVDPIAVEVASENAAVNKVSETMTVGGDRIQTYIGGEFDVVVANLTAEVIVDLMPQLAGCLRRRGLMILSGILNDLREGVEMSAHQDGCEIVERRQAGDWSALVLRRSH